MCVNVIVRICGSARVRASFFLSLFSLYLFFSLAESYLLQYASYFSFPFVSFVSTCVCMCVSWINNAFVYYFCFLSYSWTQYCGTLPSLFFSSLSLSLWSDFLFDTTHWIDKTCKISAYHYIYYTISEWTCDMVTFLISVDSNRKPSNIFHNVQYWTQLICSVFVCVCFLFRQWSYKRFFLFVGFSHMSKNWLWHVVCDTKINV